MANNGATSGKIAQNILDAMEILSQAEVQAAQFDKTIVGIIVECEDQATGCYKVQYQNAIFVAYSSALDVTYTKGTSVQVKVPNNDFSGRKIIIGTAEENGIDYTELVEDSLLRYEFIGIDCIESTAQNDLSSYWDVDKNNIILYDKDDNINLIGLNTRMVAENIANGDSLLLGATIKTALPEEQKFKGNYGIIYTLTFSDMSNVENTIDRYYIVDIDKMSGDPYNYNKASDQIIPFDIDNNNFLYIKKIELFGRDFPLQNNSKPADIFISNLRFQVANRIPDEEFEGTALTILTPDGNYFEGAEQQSVKRAIAQVRIKGKIATRSNIKYYWYIEDLRVSRSDIEGYHRYGGRGWKCLNRYNVVSEINGEPNEVDYISGNSEINIRKDTTNARETRYKCVVIYNGLVLSKEFSFINYDADIVRIEYDRNPNFIDSIGATTLTCVANNGITYQWAKIDKEGGFEALKETAADNNNYENNYTKYVQLQEDIKNGIKPNNETNKNFLDIYYKAFHEYDYRCRIKGNQIINLQAGDVFQEVTYKCQVFDSNGVSLGIGAQIVTNLLRAGMEEQTGNLIINNGIQIYKYDAKGIAPTSEQYENPQVIQPLSFTLRTAEGIEIPQSAINNTDIFWIVPTEHSMIKNYFGSLMAEYEDEGYAVYNGKSLSYTIRDNYYFQYDNNTIELQVRYRNMLYVAKTNLIFLKDGDDGTNGTQFVLRIVPDDDTIGRLKVVQTQSSEVTGSTWLRAQLWYNGIKVYEGFGDGTATTGKKVKLTWSMVGDRRTGHNITVTSNNANPPLWRLVKTSSYSADAVDIAKATINYEGMDIVGTLPIIVTTNLNTNYQVSLKSGTGYTHVVYSEDGKTPDYDSNSPFEITVWKKINGEWGDITGSKNLSYNWSSVGNLELKKGYTSADAAVMFEPIGDYDSEKVNNAVFCTIKENSTTIATLHIPIHFLLDTYGHSALNSWDGNSIQLDADGNTMLLAPQAGFGDKNSDNSYNGVLLGAIKDYTTVYPTTNRGLFGYYHGVRTIFLDSDTGSATFGATGKAQIILDPSEDQAIIRSGNYNTSRRTGMMINLTTPEIRYGSGNFFVDSNGYLEASGVDVSGTITAYYGSIGGWQIIPSKIYKGMVGLSSDNSSNYNKAFWAGSSNPDSAVFSVDFYGNLLAKTAEIGNGYQRINIGKSSDGYSAIYYGKENLLYNSNGFYIGTNGIALGPYDSIRNVSKFQVNADGTMYSEDAYISGTIDAKAGSFGSGENKIHIGGDNSNTWLYTQDHSSYTSTAAGFYIGTNGWSVGGNFRIDRFGEIRTSDWIRSMTDINSTSTGSWIGMNKGVLKGGRDGEEYGYLGFDSQWNNTTNSVFILRSHTDLAIDTPQLYIGTYEKSDNLFYVSKAFTGDKVLKYVTDLHFDSTSVENVGTVLTYGSWMDHTETLHFKNGILLA